MAESNQTNKYAYLSRLSTKELEAILRADAESPNAVNDEAIFYILEVIEQREREHPSGSFPDVDSSWKEFQTIYNTPEGIGKSLYPTEDEENTRKTEYAPQKSNRRRVLRRPLVVAAIIVLLIASLTIPVAGYGNLLEMIGSWTADQFTFIATGQHRNSDQGKADAGKVNTSDSQAGAELAQVLQENGIGEPIVPSWMPDGFELVGEISVQEYPDFNRVDLSATYANESDFFIINLVQYADPIPGRIYEKISGEPEIYTAGSIDHYIIQNTDTCIAAWYVDNLECSINTSLSITDLKRAIDSIY